MDSFDTDKSHALSKEEFKSLITVIAGTIIVYEHDNGQIYLFSRQAAAFIKMIQAAW